MVTDLFYHIKKLLFALHELCLGTGHYLPRGGGPLYLGGGSLFFELHFGEGHFSKKIIEGRATSF